MVFEKVKNVMVDIMGICEEEILLESHLYDELDVDSLDMAQITLALENEYTIEIGNEEIAEFETVEDLVKNIESKING